jgi:hypothetical protein
MPVQAYGPPAHPWVPPASPTPATNAKADVSPVPPPAVAATPAATASVPFAGTPAADGCCPPSCCPPTEPYVHHLPCEPYLHDVPDPEAFRGHLYYARAEYLLWAMKRQTAPRLLIVGTPGEPGTFAIGGGDLEFQDLFRHGTRLTLGRWLDMRQTLALEASIFVLPEHTSTSLVRSTGVPLLSVPFIDAATGTARNLILAQPTTPPPLTFSQTGSSRIEAVDRFWGADISLRKELCRRSRFQLDLLGGLRYLDLEEELNITNNTLFSAAPIIFSDADVTFFDSFNAHNQFIGAHIGASAEFNYGRFFVNLWGKAAVGNNRQTVDIEGSTVTRAPPPTLLGNQNLVGGIFAQPTNIGQHRRDQLAFVPEAGLNLGYQCSDRLRLFGGYSILYINNVVRPGDHIDTTTTSPLIAQFVGTTPTVSNRPAFAFRESEFWTQGLNFGVEFRY